MVEGVTQGRRSPVTPQDALEDALAILGRKDLALQFEGLVAVEARAVADSTRVLSRLPESVSNHTVISGQGCRMPTSSTRVVRSLK